MADGPDLGVQKAVIAALRADAGVTALVAGRVYDEPPQSPVYPFIRLGRLEQRADRTSCGRDALVDYTVECHSRPTAGRVEALRMAQAVIAALDQAAIVVPDFALCWNDFTASAVARDADGLSYVATAVFEAALDA